MEALLKESGKFFYGLRRQTFSLLFTSTILFINVLVIFHLIEFDKIAVDEFHVESEDEAEFKVTQQPHYLVYEHPLLSLKSQFFARCILQVSFFGGIFIGYSFSWFIFSSLRPKIILLLAISLNAVLVFFSGFIPYFWLFIGFRILTGIIVAIGQSSVALLFLDWNYASNQPLAIHFMFSTRSIALFIVCFMMGWNLSWRKVFFFVHPFTLIVAVILIFIFVKESPRWLRKHGKLSEYSMNLVDFGKKLGKNITGEDVFADDLDSRDPMKRSPLPTPGELTMLVGFYVLNSIASIIFQGSTSYNSLSWTTEVGILASIYGLAAIVTTPLYNYGKIPTMVFMIIGICLTSILMFLPNGIIYGTFLQAAKFNSAIIDHFAIFLIFSICSPLEGDKWPAITQREWRGRILLGIESIATLSRILGIFFVLQRKDATKTNDRIIKLILCILCYILGLILVLIGHFFCKRPKRIQKTGNDDGDDDEESHKPFIPDNEPEKPQQPFPPRKPINNDPSDGTRTPTSPDPSDIEVGENEAADGEEDGDVDIDI